MTLSEFDLVAGAESVEIILEDGSTYDAFVLKNDRAARKAAVKFPILNLSTGKETILVGVKTSLDDPKITRQNTGKAQIAIGHRYSQSHWVAGMLKAAYLTMFDLIGYKATFDPFGDSLRRELAQYFYDNGTSADAPKYFIKYANAIKLVGRGSKLPIQGERYEKVDFDTLNDRRLLFHFTPCETVFAVTCIFQINNATVSVTIPQSTHGANVVMATKFYDRLMNGEKDLMQIVRLAEFKGSHWEVSREDLRLHYPER